MSVTFNKFVCHQFIREKSETCCRVLSFSFFHLFVSPVFTPFSFLSSCFFLLPHIYSSFIPSSFPESLPFPLIPPSFLFFISWSFLHHHFLSYPFFISFSPHFFFLPLFPSVFISLLLVLSTYLFSSTHPFLSSFVASFSPVLYILSFFVSFLLLSSLLPPACKGSPHLLPPKAQPTRCKYTSPVALNSPTGPCTLCVH